MKYFKFDDIKKLNVIKVGQDNRDEILKFLTNSCSGHFEFTALRSVDGYNIKWKRPGSDIFPEPNERTVEIGDYLINEDSNIVRHLPPDKFFTIYIPVIESEAEEDTELLDYLRNKCSGDKERIKDMEFGYWLGRLGIHGE